MDDNQQEFAPDTVSRLTDLMMKHFKDVFSTFWEATPNTIPPGSDFPLMVIQKMEGDGVIGPTSTDEVTESILITLMLNKADDAGSSNVRTTTMRRLQQLVEGRDPQTLHYASTTILYVLRTFLTLLDQNTGAYLIDSDVHVKYDQMPRSDVPAIAIAEIRLNTQLRVIVPRNG